MALLMDGDTGLMEDLPFDSLSRGLMMMNGYKSTIYDPDTPNYSQAMSGKYSEEYKKEMKEEIESLERNNTWVEIDISNVPEGEKILPTTWAFKDKRYPDGRLRKFKARF